MSSNKQIFSGVILAFLLSGCTFSRGHLAKAQAAVSGNRARVDEEVRMLATGVVDTLAKAPTNEFVALAGKLAKSEQLLVGVPASRLDVDAILAGEKYAREALLARLKLQEGLLSERARLETNLKAREAVLIEKGGQFEAEQNKNHARTFWRWLVSTFGIGGLIALCVFCPAAIPLLAQFFGWVVSKIPSLAGGFGIVSRKAFDAVVAGVAEVRSKLKAKGDSGTLEMINAELAKSTDQEHRELNAQRRAVMKV